MKTDYETFLTYCRIHDKAPGVFTDKSRMDQSGLKKLIAEIEPQLASLKKEPEPLIDRITKLKGTRKDQNYIGLYHAIINKNGKKSFNLRAQQVNAVHDRHIKPILGEDFGEQTDLNGFLEIIAKLLKDVVEEKQKATDNKAAAIKPKKDAFKKDTTSDYADFKNTVWYFYIYQAVKFETPYTIIAKFVLHYVDHDKILLYSPEDISEKKDLLGKVINAEINRHDILEMQFPVNVDKDPNCVIRVIRPTRAKINKESLFWGQYMSLPESGQIVSGACILERAEPTAATSINGIKENHAREFFLQREILIDNQKYSAAQIELFYKAKWTEFIPEPIGKYLSHHRKNYRKTSGAAISDLASLKQYVDAAKNKLVHEPKFNSVIDYDIFLVTPVDSLDEKTRKAFEEEIDKAFFKLPVSEIPRSGKNRLLLGVETIKKLADEGMDRIYYPPRILRIRGVETGNVPRVENLIKYELPEMRKSRYVVFILPEPVLSTAFIKIGWAIDMEKPVFVYRTKNIDIPDLLNTLIPNRIIPRGVLSIENIVNDLCLYYPDKLNSG